MLYDVKTPREYFDKLENDWRKEKLVLVYEMIKKKWARLN